MKKTPQEIRVVEKDGGVEVTVKAETTTAMALLTIAIIEVAENAGFDSARDLVSILDDAVTQAELDKKEPLDKDVHLVPDMARPLVKWLEKNAADKDSRIVITQDGIIIEGVK